MPLGVPVPPMATIGRKASPSGVDVPGHCLVTIISPPSPTPHWDYMPYPYSLDIQ